MKTYALSLLVGFDLLIDTEEELQAILDAITNDISQIRMTYSLNGQDEEAVSDMVSEVHFTSIAGD